MPNNSDSSRARTPAGKTSFEEAGGGTGAGDPALRTFATRLENQTTMFAKIGDTFREFTDRGAQGRLNQPHVAPFKGDEDPRGTRPACGGLLKRATVSFGQALFPGDMERADEAARRCDLLLAVGSTLGVYPVAAMVPVAVRHGAAVVVGNGSPDRKGTRLNSSHW